MMQTLVADCQKTEERFWQAAADPYVHVVYVVQGSCQYRGVAVNQGDVLVCGLNKGPQNSRLMNCVLFTITMDFSLYYQMTEMVPALFAGTALKLECDNPFYQLGLSLSERPMRYWVATAETFMQKMIRQHDVRYSPQFKRVTEAANILAETWEQGTEVLHQDFAVSYRQLQRDFVSVMGLTPKEYAGLLRFNQAFKLLDEYNLTDAALNAGYWDQAHMIRDFKKMSGFTPAQVRKLYVRYI
ncbi:MAG: Helix-turn-helix, AraC domain [Firmicutes bacterium]|nr:Helix-turn-helix, AraC domain [Bacillota bacterium]